MTQNTSFTARVLLAALPDSLPVAAPGVRIEANASAVPADVLSAAAGRAWYWPEAADAMAPHGAHLVVSLAAEVGPAVDRALALTKAVAALVAKLPALGVLWDATNLAHEPSQWCAQSDDATPDDLPLFLWIAFDGSENDDGTRSLRTLGLRGFDALEIEVAASRRDGEDLLEAVCDVALFVLTSSVALEDGEQIEVTQGKVRVRIEPSLRNDGHKAYRLRVS